MEDDIDFQFDQGTYRMRSKDEEVFFVRIYYEGGQLEVFVGSTLSDAKDQADAYLMKLGEAVSRARVKIKELKGDHE